MLRIEAVACSTGDRFRPTFDSAETPWRQGVWLAVDGELVVDDQTADQVVLWRDTAPDQLHIEVRAADDGLMRFYNVWDSGRGLGSWKSQSHTCGMVPEAVAKGYRYWSSDIASPPTFQALVFTLERD